LGGFFFFLWVLGWVGAFFIGKLGGLGWGGFVGGGGGGVGGEFLLADGGGDGLNGNGDKGKRKLGVVEVENGGCFVLE
jgi:hypothetical protein